MIAWFAETFDEAPGQAHDADREELEELVKARKGLIDLQTDLQTGRTCAAASGSKRLQRRCLKKPGRRNGHARGRNRAPRSRPHQRFADRAEIIESVPGLAETAAAGVIAGLPELGQVSNKIAAALVGRRPLRRRQRQRQGERHIKGGRRWVRKAALHVLVSARHAAQPGAQGLLSTPDRQGEGAEGRARRLHAQAHRHSQHHDRPPARNGIPAATHWADRAHPIRARSRPSACKANSPVSGRGQGRQPPKAGARCASLEAGRSPGYFSTVAPR